MHAKDVMLGNESIGNLIVKLSVPAIVGLMVQALYNLVDTIFIGRGLGEQSMLGIAGISVAFPVQILMMAIALGVGIGGSSIISRSLGKKDILKAERTVANMITLVLVASIAFTALALVFLDPMLKVFGASDTVLPFANEYTRYIVIGTTFFTFSAAMSNAIRAEGNTRFAMAIMVLSSIANIILDPLFIFEFGMGVKGAAIATVISQVIGCIMVIYYYASSMSRVNLIIAYMRPDTGILSETISIGMSEFVFNVVESSLFLLFNQSLLFYGGDVAIAVFGIVIKVFMLTLMPIIGIKQGIQPIVGYNYGANEFARVKKTISLSNYIVTGICILSTVVVFLIPGQIMRIFSNDPQLIEMGITALKISFLMMPFIGYQVVATALLQSLGKSKGSLIVTLSRQIIFLPPLVIILPWFFGLNGIWISFPISDFLACVVAVLITRKEISMMKHENAEKV
ncbi:MATE family efflux transporter [Methanococcoides sp. LMO-2]|uniref:Multidrug export protein MepA n=1 Tax=Methanococcoides cohabitans TaxID=3136559 RepID=A0ABU9KUB4_9EURY